MGQHKRTRPTSQERGAIMARFAESELSVEAFCRRESISPSSFYRWRSLLGDRAPRASRRSHSAAEFVELGALPASRERLELRFDLGGGVVLHVVRG
jgi:putative transposase